MINIESLPKRSLSKRTWLPKLSVIYFCLHESGLTLYIGQTVNLRQRFQSHERLKVLEEIGNVFIAWLECDKKYLRDEESQYIHLFQPILNGNYQYIHLSYKDTPKVSICLSEETISIITPLLNSYVKRKILSTILNGIVDNIYRPKLWFIRIPFTLFSEVFWAIQDYESSLVASIT